MYAANFGLEKGLFEGGIAHDADVFRSGLHEPLFANFKMALAVPDAVVTLCGPAGVGKTTLTSAALRASTTRLALAWLNATPTNGTELLELLLIELGMSAHRMTRIERLQMWRQFLNEMSATDSRLFVVVERTEDLAPEVLRALDALTAADASGCDGANVVLLGQPGLDQYLANPLLDSLRQRIRLRQQLKPFTRTELADYLRHRVDRAGGHFDRIFAPGTVDAIQDYSAGVARVADNLCETALNVAAAEGQQLLTAEIISKVATTWLGLAAAPATALPRAAMPPAAPLAEPSLATTPEPTALREPVVSKPATPASAAPAPIAAPHPAPPVATSTQSAVPAAAPTQSQEAAVIAQTPRPAATPTAPTPAPVFAPPPAPKQAPSRPVPTTDYDFDGTATDIPDVSLMDFPVLTDAVDDLPQAGPSVPPPPPRPSAAPKASASPTAVTAPSRPVASAPKRVETAYVKRTPASAPEPQTAAAQGRPAAPRAAPLSAASAPPAGSSSAAHATPPADEDTDSDALRQTQTMRAISVAKSIDDISSSMAETLFGEADLDMLSAALASAGWSESEAEAPEQPSSEPTRGDIPPVDDILDLFDLGPDAPLELIDDSPSPSNSPRKVATRR